MSSLKTPSGGSAGVNGGASPHIIRRINLPKAEHISSKEIARAKWLGLYEYTYKDPSGRERKWECLERTKKPSGEVDAVVVMAILKRTLKYDCLILVKQYRPPLKAYTLEFPSGLVDEGETASTAASREFKEETGYTCKIKHCSPTMCLDPGTENCTLMLASAEIDGDDPANKSAEEEEAGNRHEGEFIEVFRIPVNGILEALNEYSSQGLIVHAAVYSYAMALSQATRQHETDKYETEVLAPVE